MTTPLTYSGWARTEPVCERYAVHELLPGMSHDMVLSKMGGEGVKTLIRVPDSRETSGVDYPSPTTNVYVEYDRRVDRRTPARAVRVRASMPLLPATVQSLVGRFGPPDAGADDLVEGLREGAAVWVDEPCGVVLSAYRSSASWWAAGAGTFLQVESLDVARQGLSPASPRLGEILARKHGPAAAPVPTIPRTVPAPPPMSVRITATVKNEPPAPPAPPPQARAIPPSPPPLPVPRGTDKPPDGPAVRITAAVKAGPPAPPAPLPEARAIPPSAPPLPKPRGTSKPSDGPAARITFVPPVYPATAKWLGVKGHVTLEIALRADGSVASRPRVVAARPLGRGFEEAAVNAVRTWRFKPAIRGGRSVASSLRIDVDFK